MIIFISVTILIILGMFFSDKVLKIAVTDRDRVFEIALDREEFSLDKYNHYLKEEIVIESRYGYKINGYSLKSLGNRGDKVIVFSHGVATNCISSIKYAEFFIEDGWDVIIYDHRRHGNTSGATTTYGYLEKHDMDSVVTFVKDKYPHDIHIGIHGESMGAAIAIQYAAYYGNVDFFIFDCPYSNLGKQLKYRLRIEYKLLGFLIIPLTNFFIKLREGFNFFDVSPINVVHKIVKPTLFLHSKNDKYILSKMCEDLFNKKIDDKFLYLAEEGGHAESYTKNREKYKQVVREFISSYGS